ncbi:7736_t:CDS:2 [Entrophospora sp. SA101]|nr:7736_t:CDS:2 [Entrophospora sp. SA101]
MSSKRFHEGSKRKNIYDVEESDDEHEDSEDDEYSEDEDENVWKTVNFRYVLY